MTHQNDSLTTHEQDEQFMVSYELLCLLKWLTENNGDLFKSIIITALRNGLKDRLYKLQHYNEIPSMEEMQHIMVEFFGMMETILTESVTEEMVKQAVEKKLMPAIDRIDSSVCDDTVVRFSMEKAAQESDADNQKQAQQLLFEELLKRWNPNKKNVVN